MLSKQSPDGGTVGAVGGSSVAGIVSTPPPARNTTYLFSTQFIQFESHFQPGVGKSHIDQSVFEIFQH